MNKKVIIKDALVANLPELKKLIAEFGKIGSNLNQIARHRGSGGTHSQEMRNNSVRNTCLKLPFMKPSKIFEVIKTS